MQSPKNDDLLAMWNRTKEYMKESKLSLVLALVIIGVFIYVLTCMCPRKTDARCNNKFGYQVINDLRKSGFGYSDLHDNLSKIKDIKERAKLISEHCEKGVDQCLFPLHGQKKETKPLIRTDLLAVDLDELEELYDRLNELLNKTNNYKHRLPVVNETAAQRAFGRAPTKAMYNLAVNHEKEQDQDKIEEVTHKLKKIRETLEGLGMAYDANKAESFGEAYLSELAQRRKLIRDHCPYGPDGLERDSCRLPLYMSKKPTYPERGPVMYDLRALEKRHRQIGEWIKRTGNEVDVMPQYNLKGDSVPIRSMFSNQDDYLKTSLKPSILPEEFIRDENLNTEAYRIRDRSSGNYLKYTKGDDANKYNIQLPPKGTVVRDRSVDRNEQLEDMGLETGDYFAVPAFGGTGAVHIPNKEIKNYRSSKLTPNGFGSYMHMNGLPGARIDELSEKSAIIAANCPRGRDGFQTQEACLYPLYKEDKPNLSVNTWEYPEATSDYGFHTKPFPPLVRSAPPPII